MPWMAISSLNTLIMVFGYLFPAWSPFRPHPSHVWLCFDCGLSQIENVANRAGIQSILYFVRYHHGLHFLNLYWMFVIILLTSVRPGLILLNVVSICTLLLYISDTCSRHTKKWAKQMCFEYLRKKINTLTGLFVRVI